MEQLAWDIGETSHALRRAFDRRAAELGITRAQWRVLAHLDHQPGQRQVELADRMDIEPITLCRIVDKLEEGGLVERRRDPDDRRRHAVVLTPQGDWAARRFDALRDRAEARALAALDADERAALADLLTRAARGATSP